MTNYLEITPLPVAGTDIEPTADASPTGDLSSSEIPIAVTAAMARDKDVYQKAGDKAAKDEKEDSAADPAMSQIPSRDDPKSNAQEISYAERHRWSRRLVGALGGLGLPPALA